MIGAYWPVVALRRCGFILAVCALACVSGCEFQETDPESRVSPHPDPRYKFPTSRSEAMKVLQRTDRFADEAIGFGASPSAEVCAFAILMRQPDAPWIFTRLLREADVPGQVYGLLGLSLLHPGRYAAELPRFEQSNAYVRTIFGCMGTRSKVSELVRLVRSVHAQRFAEFTRCPK